MDRHHTSTKEEEKCIKACNECAQVCKETLVHCVHIGGENTLPDHLEMLMSCVKMCETSADLMTKHSSFAAQVCSLCADICEACADSCENLDDKYMKECAKTCRNCAKICRSMA